MVYTEHEIVKMQGIADLAVGLVDQDMVLAKAITHEGIEKFKGKEGDKLVFRVPGRLPARDYEFRTRNNPIVFDVYKEATTDITFSGRKYSAVETTDEQVDFDLGNWSGLITAQSTAVGRALNTKAANTIVGAPYEFTVGLGGNETELKRALLWMRATLNKLRIPAEGRMLVVGTDVETELLLSKDLVQASNVGDARAEDALANATIGRIWGFTVIVDQTIPADEAYAFVPSGFVLHTAAPAIPQSVGVGATASSGGFSLRWLRDYDLSFVKDRSLVDTYVGSNWVKDLYIPAEVKAGAAFDPATLTPHFVRGIKLSLSGASAVPTATGGKDIWADILGPGATVTEGNKPIKKFTPAADPTPAP